MHICGYSKEQSSLNSAKILPWGTCTRTLCWGKQPANSVPQICLSLVPIKRHRCLLSSSVLLLAHLYELDYFTRPCAHHLSWSLQFLIPYQCMNHQCICICLLLFSCMSADPLTEWKTWSVSERPSTSWREATGVSQCMMMMWGLVHTKWISWSLQFCIH